MKTLTLIVASVVTATTLFAVEFVAKTQDGTSMFTCERSGTVGKIRVKARGNGKYYVVSRKPGTSGFTGIIYSDSEGGAAQEACKER